MFGRIIISTHVKYEQPLQRLFDSINKYCPNLYKQTLLIVNGCDEECIEEGMHLNSKNAMTKIFVTADVFEWTLFNAVEKYYQDPRIYAEYYMCIHDTCEVGPAFEQKVHKFMECLKSHPYLRNRTDQPIQILKPKGTTSNICIFHRDQIIRFAPNVSEITSKGIGVHMEHGTHPLSLYHPDALRNIPVVHLAERTHIGSLDVYQSGHPRGVFYYPCFDLRKYVFLNCDGDIVGNVKKIINPYQSDGQW